MTLTDSSATWIANLSFNDLSAFYFSQKPFNISGTNYFLVLPKHDGTVTNMILKRIDFVLFDLASSANILLPGTISSMWFGKDIEGTSWSAIGKSTFYLVDHTNISSDSITKSYVLPETKFGICEMENTDFFLIGGNLVTRVSLSTDAIEATFTAPAITYDIVRVEGT